MLSSFHKQYIEWSLANLNEEEGKRQIRLVQWSLDQFVLVQQWSSPPSLSLSFYSQLKIAICLGP